MRLPGHENCRSCPQCGLTCCPDCDSEGRACPPCPAREPAPTTADPRLCPLCAGPVRISAFFGTWLCDNDQCELHHSDSGRGYPLHLLDPPA